MRIIEDNICFTVYGDETGGIIRDKRYELPDNGEIIVYNDGRVIRRGK